MKTKPIRSLRLANELAASGHRILRTEPCRDNSFSKIRPHYKLY